MMGLPLRKFKLLEALELISLLLIILHLNHAKHFLILKLVPVLESYYQKHNAIAVFDLFP